jgi:transcriptional antiterminator RfaH
VVLAKEALMNWYVVHTKPRQEQRALQNLMWQGFECYLPTLAVEKIKQGVLSIVVEPMFARYLFIQLDDSGSGRSWSPIRSTKGVSRLVTFGGEAAKVADDLIVALRARAALEAAQPRRLFTQGMRVRMTEGPFADVEGIYQIADGERRAMVLIELLNKPVRLSVPAEQLRMA